MIRREVKPEDNHLYLKALEALKENGYESHEIEYKFNRKWVSISRQGNAYGWVFVVADRKPCLLFSIIGVFWGWFRNFLLNETGTYNQMVRIIKINEKKFKRNGYEIGVYWPEGSNVGAYTAEYAEHEWLSIVQKAVS